MNAKAFYDVVRQIEASSGVLPSDLAGISTLTTLAIAYKADIGFVIPLVTCGALSDNLKKVTELDESRDPELIANLKLADAAGDYFKDVMFPFMAANYVLFFLSDYLCMLDNVVRNLLGSVILGM